MAREILFKAKRLDNGKWVEGQYLLIKEKVYIILEAETSCMDSENTDLYATQWHEVMPETLCRYIGLTDKNENKIWENDIVEVPGEYEYFKIEWENDSARYVMNGDSLVVDFDNYCSYEVEVIGNIFDNSELLEEANG